MNTVRVRAHAKINLTLDVVGTEGGYHLLDSLVTTVALADRIKARPRRDGAVCIRMHGMGSERILPQYNNAQLAAERFCAAFGTAGADIVIQKHIPIGGGLGGSSADAAGVLRALSALYAVTDMGAVKRIADGLGSDTGYLLTGGFARIQGRGDRVTPLAGAPEQFFLIACPRRGVSTPKCFAAFDALGKTYPPLTERALEAIRTGKEGVFGNHLTEAACTLNGEIADALRALSALSPCGAGMTGSGSACYAVFPSEAQARSAQARLRGWRTILTKTYSSEEEKE